jgi:hypothetical protein
LEDFKVTSPQADLAECLATKPNKRVEVGHLDETQVVERRRPSELARTADAIRNWNARRSDQLTHLTPKRDRLLRSSS